MGTAATASSTTLTRPTPGHDGVGRPDGIEPTRATPWLRRSAAHDATTDTTVTTSRVGNRGAHRPPATSSSKVTAAIANVSHLTEPGAPSVKARTCSTGVP